MPKKKADKRVLVLVGGGLDSAVAAYQAKAAGNEVWGLSVHYGQDALAALVAAKTLSDEYAVGFKGLGLRNLSEIWIPWDAGMPYGNKPGKVEIEINKYTAKYLEPLLAIIGAAYGESIDAKALIMGYTKDDFAEGIGEFVLSQPTRLRISAPFELKTKAEVVKLGVKLEVPFDLTWSCLYGSLQAIPCGECKGCIARAAAFKAAKVEDPLLSEDSKLRWLLKGGQRGGN